MSEQQLIESAEPIQHAHDQPAKLGNGKRLTARQIASLLSLHESGLAKTEIGRRLGCHHSTVDYYLDRFGDTREIARKKLENGALKLAETVVRTKNGDTALKALGKLDVVREDQAQGGNNILIAIGQQDNGKALEPPVITLSPQVSHDLHRLTDDK